MGLANSVTFSEEMQVQWMEFGDTRALRPSTRSQRTGQAWRAGK